MNRKTIYVVTKGSYSDYHIIGLYEKKEVAEKVAKVMGDSYDTAYVEEFKLNVEYPKLYIYLARVNAEDGSLDECYIYGSTVIEQDYFQDWKKNYCAYGETKDEAIKNARDYRAKTMAQKEGI
jgi:hypothetical protein